MKIFEKLLLWVDPVKRPGPEAMAVDEWLLETTRQPVLRIYEWAGDWVSLGYFGKIEEARSAFPGVELVRRWSGGGMVDHRKDWTYTVVAPQGEPVAAWRGAESYRRLHAALVQTLGGEGIEARLSEGFEETGATLCFENPVSHDLLGSDGRKLAGAGQRRSRQGLLHQGSLGVPVANAAASLIRAKDFAGRIASEWEMIDLGPQMGDLSNRICTRYASAKWTERR